MPAKRQSTSTTSSPATATTLSSNASSASSSAANTLQSLPDIANTIWTNYQRETPLRTKLIDAFMGFLMVVGALQFVYVCLVGNYPFNAFLSGFSACVGQFVLAASLRIQTSPVNKLGFGGRSDERAFAEFVFGSLILHFFCVNFIN